MLRYDALMVTEEHECEDCGETLVRVAQTGNLKDDFREKSSYERHKCWVNLPEMAEHLRLD